MQCACTTRHLYHFRYTILVYLKNMNIAALMSKKKWLHDIFTLFRPLWINHYLCRQTLVTWLFMTQYLCSMIWQYIHEKVEKKYRLNYSWKMTLTQSGRICETWISIRYYITHPTAWRFHRFPSSLLDLHLKFDKWVFPFPHLFS